jgi:hypothetical protein
VAIAPIIMGMIFVRNVVLGPSIAGTNSMLVHPCLVDPVDDGSSGS